MSTISKSLFDDLGRSAFPVTRAAERDNSTVGSKALRTSKATPAQIRSMGGRIESELADVAKGKKKR